MANHRKAIRVRDRRVVSHLPARSTCRARWCHQAAKPADASRSPEAIVLLLSAVSRFLMTENAFDLDIGHLEVIDFVEGCIREVEGERLTTYARGGQVAVSGLSRGCISSLDEIIWFELCQDSAVSGRDR